MAVPGETRSSVPLSPRELEVVRLLVDGQAPKQIGARLGISPRTVRTHLEAAMVKTGTRGQTQLAVAAVRLGLA